MSIVEKAVAKLRALRPAIAVSESSRVAPQAPSSIERVRDQTKVAARTAPAAAPVQVDSAALARAGLQPADADALRKLGDELRRAKRPLLANVMGRGTSTPRHVERIVVASALPDEGKTFTALNLALSLARERDFEVLLVDGDGPKADITRTLGLEQRPGLMDALADEQCQPIDVIVPTDVPNLLVVPAGKRHALAAELYGSLRMEYVLEQLGGRNARRLMVFDAPPLLATPEAPALIAHMGQVVMVVAAGRTSRQAVDAALQQLPEQAYVGLLLNMSRLPASENPYDSYDYYGRQPADHEAET